MNIREDLELDNFRVIARPSLCSEAHCSSKLVRPDSTIHLLIGITTCNKT